MNKLELPRVTLWASMHSKDQAYFERTIRVLRYCNRIIRPARTVLFSHIHTEEFEYWPCYAKDMKEWSTFVNFGAPLHFSTDFALQVHEDGFPIDVSKWTDEFFNYDYIGSPWPSYDVGNGGFVMESKPFYQGKMKLPVPPETTLADVYLCRDKKTELEAMGLRFAPFELAAQFGCEFPGFKHMPHFGFHGQSPDGDYKRAWEILKATE